MSGIIEVQSLTAGYGKTAVIRDVSFEVKQGEFCAVIGLNGCGKTTLLKSLCSFIGKTSGICLVDGHDVSKLNDKERAGLISFIPQRFTSVEGISCLDVVLMGLNPYLKLFENPKKEDMEKAFSILKDLGLASKANTDFSCLSEGQKQLVVFARSLIQDTPVMIFDEPDSALDFVNRHTVLAKIREVTGRSGKTVIAALHDVNSAIRYCDRLILMKDGSITGDISVNGISAEDLKTSLEKVLGQVRILGTFPEIAVVKGE